MIISFMNSLNGPAEISGDIKMLFDTFRATVMTPTPHLAVCICEKWGEIERDTACVSGVFTIVNMFYVCVSVWLSVCFKTFLNQ